LRRNWRQISVFSFGILQDVILEEFVAQIEASTGGPLDPKFGEAPMCVVGHVFDWPAAGSGRLLPVSGRFRSHCSAINPTISSLLSLRSADKVYLRRFLRARQHDIPRAKEMFLAHLQWRHDNSIDTILDDFHFHERDAFLTLYPQGYHKTDRLGRPIYIQHLGHINMKALHGVTTEDRMVRYHIQEYERAIKYIFPACSMVAGREVTQTLAVMDVKGVGLRHLSGEVKRILGALTRIDQDNYPETLGKTLIINAPSVFKMVWAIVKPMLDARTQAKIEVCPTDYLQVLTQWVDIESIPEYLGGASKGSLIDDLGPWNDPEIVARLDSGYAAKGIKASKAGAGPAATAAAEDGGEISPVDSLISPSPFVTEMDSLPSEHPSSFPGFSTTTATTATGAAGAPAPRSEAEESDIFEDAVTRKLSIISSGGSACEQALLLYFAFLFLFLIQSEQPSRNYAKIKSPFPCRRLRHRRALLLH
jgi:hypothetical protein